MELSRVAEIDNARANNIEKVQKINEIDDKDKKVLQDDEYKKALGKVEVQEKNEVILDNVKFGYNKNSEDFFVKVTKGDIEYKYPTEDMMKVKAFFLKELETSLSK